MGYLRGGEVDFVATKPRERVYIQVTEDMHDEETMRRELASLRKIGDEYRKMVIVQDGTYPSDVDGIEMVNVVDFLLRGVKPEWRADMLLVSRTPRLANRIAA